MDPTYVKAALAALYGILLPFMSLYVFKEYDPTHYNQLKGHYEKIFYLPAPPAPTPIPKKSIEQHAYEQGIKFVKKSYGYAAYQWAVENEFIKGKYTAAKTEVAPVYREYAAPIVENLKIKFVHLILNLRPYYSKVVDFISPYSKFCTEQYASASKTAAPYLKTGKENFNSVYKSVEDFAKPYYTKHGAPLLEKISVFNSEHVVPFLEEHQDAIVTINSLLIGFALSQLLFRDSVSKFFKSVFSSIYGVNQEIHNRYKTTTASTGEGTSTILIEDVPESEKAQLLAAVKKVDEMRPLDPIVQHEEDFVGIIDSSKNSTDSIVDDDSTTKVDIPARHPNRPKNFNSNSNSKSAATAAQKAFQKANGKSQIKKSLKNEQSSFLAKSLANVDDVVEILANEENEEVQEPAHLEVQVQVQEYNDNQSIEIVEQIEDEMAGKGLPYVGGKEEVAKEEEKVEDDDDGEDDSDDDDDDGDDSESANNTEELIQRKINSISDSSSEMDETPKEARLPKFLKELGSPQKYNTGLFYNASSNGLITAAIPESSSPTKPAFGVIDGRPKMSSTPSLLSVSSNVSNPAGIYVNNGNGAHLLVTNSSASKPATGIVSEETVYATSNGDESVLITHKRSIQMIGDLATST